MGVDFARFMTPDVASRHDFSQTVGDVRDYTNKTNEEARNQSNLDRQFALSQKELADKQTTSKAQLDFQAAEAARHGQEFQQNQQKEYTFANAKYAQEHQQELDKLLGEYAGAVHSGNADKIAGLHQQLAAHGMTIDDGTSQAQAPRLSPLMPGGATPSPAERSLASQPAAINRTGVGNEPIGADALEQKSMAAPQSLSLTTPGGATQQAAPPQAQKETTQLNPAQEQQFQAWLKKNKIRDANESDSFYDYRGAFLAGVRPKGGHWPDTFKQHGHETFSEESQYSSGPGDGGHWLGDKFVPGTASQGAAPGGASNAEQGLPAEQLQSPKTGRRFSIRRDGKELAVYDEAATQAAHQKQVQAAFQPLVTGATRPEEADAAKKAMAYASGLVAQGTVTPEEAVKAGRDEYDKTLDRYRKMLPNGGAGGSAGASTEDGEGPMSKQEQARRGTANTEVRSWEATVKNDTKYQDSVKARQSLAGSLSLLNNSSGLSDRTALAKVIKEHFGAAASEGERSFFLGGAGKMAEFNGVLNQYVGGLEAGKFDPKLLAQLKQMLMTGMKNAEITAEQAGERLASALDAVPGVLTQAEKKKLIPWAKSYMGKPSGTAGAPAQSSGGSDREAARKWLAEHPK